METSLQISSGGEENAPNSLPVSPARNGRVERVGTFHALPFAKAEIERSLTDRFAWVAGQIPDRPAIVANGEAISYGHLMRAARRVARAVGQNATIGHSGPVAILAQHGFDTVAAMLGVLLAGRAYVALDAHNPIEWQREILADTGSETLVSSAELVPLASESMRRPGAVIDLAALPDEPDAEVPVVRTGPDDTAALYYTSGSTGRPKGVIRSHRVLLHRFWSYYQRTAIGTDDRCSFIHGASYSASIDETLAVLLHGAAVCPFDLRRSTMGGLTEWLRRERITIFTPPITFLRRVMDYMEARRISLPDVRLVGMMGQPVYRYDAERFRALFAPDCLLVNQYGQTETALNSLFVVDRQTQLEGERIPSGFAMEDSEIFLRDENGNVVDEIGAVGQIAIRSSYLSEGYWNRPDLSAAKFLPDPEGGTRRICLTGDLGRFRADGCLEHVGRKDEMVKIRGFRVEPGQVEAVLAAQPEVKECAVAVVEKAPGEARLVAYWSARHDTAMGAEMTDELLRQRLQRALPPYMIPWKFVRLHELPLTANGKVERQALPTPNPA